MYYVFLVPVLQPGFGDVQKQINFTTKTYVYIRKTKIMRFTTHRMKYLVRALEVFGDEPVFGDELCGLGDELVFGDELCAWR